MSIPPAGPPLHQVSKTVAESGGIVCACKGFFTQQSSREILLARENSFQLFSTDLEPLGPVQPLFARVEDLKVLRRDDCIGLGSSQEVCPQQISLQILLSAFRTGNYLEPCAIPNALSSVTLISGCSQYTFRLFIHALVMA